MLPSIDLRKLASSRRFRRKKEKKKLREAALPLGFVGIAIIITRTPRFARVMFEQGATGPNVFGVIRLNANTSLDLLPDTELIYKLFLLQVQEALEVARIILHRSDRPGQHLAPQPPQAGVAFSAAVLRPQDPRADLEGSVTLPITTITMLVGAYSGRRRSQPLEAVTLEVAYSVAATQAEVSDRLATSSKPVPSETL